MRRCAVARTGIVQHNLAVPGPRDRFRNFRFLPLFPLETPAVACNFCNRPKHPMSLDVTNSAGFRALRSGPVALNCAAPQHFRLTVTGTGAAGEYLPLRWQVTRRPESDRSAGFRGGVTPAPVRSCVVAARARTTGAITKNYQKLPGVIASEAGVHYTKLHTFVAVHGAKLRNFQHPDHTKLYVPGPLRLYKILHFSALAVAENCRSKRRNPSRGGVKNVNS